MSEPLLSSSTPAPTVNGARLRPTHVVVDGLTFGHSRHGGINSWLRELLPRLAIRPATTVRLLLPRRLLGEPPAVRRVCRDLLPTRTGLSWRLDNLLEPLLERANRFLREVPLRGKRCVFHATYFASVSPAIPQVASAYDMNHELFPAYYANDWGQWLRRQYRQCLSQAARIIAISHKTKEDVVRFCGIDPSCIDVVHLAINRGRFYPESDPASLRRLEAQHGLTSPYLLYVGGRQTAYKNFDGLLTAFAQSPLRRQFTLAVAGRPWTEGEVRLLDEHGLAERVRLIADPDDDALRALYSFAAAFVYPSQHEGFGLPLLEAMACGTPVVASDIAVFREVAGDAALYFDPLRPADLARALEHAIDEHTRREYVARGFAQAARYSWDRCADETWAVYQRALEAKGG